MWLPIDEDWSDQEVIDDAHNLACVQIDHWTAAVTVIRIDRDLKQFAAVLPRQIAVGF